MVLWPFNGSPAEPTASSDPQALPHAQGSDPPLPEEGQLQNEPPKYVPADEFNRLTSTVNELAQIMKGALAPPDEPYQDAPEPIPQAPARTVTAEQINAAYAEGDYAKGAQLMAKYNAEEVRAQLHEFETTKFAPVVNGASRTMTSMSEAAAQSLPHFKRFEKEIRAAVREMGKNAAANPESWKIAYKYVVGEHSDQLIQEALETTARQRAQEPSGGAPPRGNQPKSHADLTPRDAYGDDYDGLRRMAQMSGMTAEQLVQKQYAKSNFRGTFQDYLKEQRASREDQYA